MFTEQDLRQIRERGIEVTILEKQIQHFVRGFPFINITRPATLGDGIFSFRDKEVDYYISFFSQQSNKSRIIKFVPASGAATRMFKHLFEFRESFTGSAAQRKAYLSETGFHSVHYLISHLPDIAFYNRLTHVLGRDGLVPEELIHTWQLDLLIGYILDEEGLNYANLPKGLLLFHNYPQGARTSAEEHLVEAANYAHGEDGQARIHFTISPEHREKFTALFDRVIPRYEEQLGGTFHIEFSEQLPSTDTLAVDEGNQPFRGPDGTLLFRPAGHGALLSNLNRLDETIIFVKNIDNLVPDRLKATTYRYKRLIGGYLLYIKEAIHRFLLSASDGQLPDSALDEMTRFASDHLYMKFPGDFWQQSEGARQSQLFARLNRPIRVCGMVKNEGEPGGGPFWVMDDEGHESLQIVESSQINLNDPEQRAIVNKATHFNPVDLVCCIRDYRGEKFNLADFVDEKTGFISLKSSGGRRLKAQELPGLWNGAMAKWITVFVEVPIITFNPVKTVNDLLRKEHLENSSL